MTGDELEIPWKYFKWLQCLGEVIICPVLELNNTDAHLKVVEAHVPDLSVVTTRLQLRKKEFYLRKKLPWRRWLQIFP